MCKRCTKKRTKLAGTMERLKLVMNELHESLSRLKKEEKMESNEVSPNTDGALQDHTSLVKDEQ
jgi:hypothetical protein